jgi:hypothetical protein
MGEKETKTQYFKVAGITFKRPDSENTGLDIIDQYTGHGADIRLEREPTNQYDENAIQVRQVFKNGVSVQLGYVPNNKYSKPHFLANTLAPLMDVGEEIKVSFSQKLIDKKGECRGLQLKYKFVNEELENPID